MIFRDPLVSKCVTRRISYLQIVEMEVVFSVKTIAVNVATCTAIDSFPHLYSQAYSGQYRTGIHLSEIRECSSHFIIYNYLYFMKDDHNMQCMRLF